MLGLAALFLGARDFVKVGAGSYSTEPTDQSKADDFYGSSYNTIQEKFQSERIDSALKGKRAIPTNKFWSDFIFQTANDYHGSNLWIYPHGIEGIGAGWAIKTVTGYTGNDRGCDPNSKNVDFELAPNFAQTHLRVVDWSDTCVSVVKEGSGGSAKTTVNLGSPFVWVELDNLQPVVRPVGNAKFYDAGGAAVAADAIKGSFIAANDNAYVGVHLPDGATITVEGGNPRINNAKYVVLSFLPAVTDFARFDAVARNKVTKGTFIPKYDVTAGIISSTFELTTTNLDSGAANGETLYAFLPHHWRKGKLNAEYINDLSYTTIFGKQKVAQGRVFTLQYEFGGLLPYMPEPLDLTAAQQDRLKSVVSRHVKDRGFDGNTYAKGLGEKSQIFLQARQLGIEGWDGLKDDLKDQFADWFNAAPGDTTGRYFSQYPNYGVMIGFPAGFGSQVFNDLHFHNGYFITGAARIMLVDPAFKADYGDMAQLVARCYGNWGNYETDNIFIPHMRTFDAYTGHSYAGGTGDGGGNNQESTSEAIQSSYGLFLLGVVLDKQEIIDYGATLYYLETQACAEYWFDHTNENQPVEYKHKPYVGILRSFTLACATYFDGDFGWAMGIQGCPCDHFYYQWAEDPVGIQRAWDKMIQDRISDGKVGNADAEAHVKQMGAYLGGYHLNILQQVDPDKTSKMIDSLWDGGGEWTEHTNVAHCYYNCNAFVSYGRPAAGYHTSIPTGVVYEKGGKLTYLLYNARDAAVNVRIFKGTDVVDTISVPANSWFNSRKP